MKKKIFLTLVVAVISCFSVFAQDITVIVNDKKVELDVQPRIINDRTMIPVRKVSEVANAEVEWIADARLVMITKNTKIVAMEVGADQFSVTDLLTGEAKYVVLDSPATIVDSRTLVPLRAISEVLDMNVLWDGETYTVTISSK